jgi:hypothetical protein
MGQLVTVGGHWVMVLTEVVKTVLVVIETDLVMVAVEFSPCDEPLVMTAPPEEVALEV